MGSGEISRYLPGQLEEPDSDEARGRKDRRSGETKKAGSRRRSHGRLETESCPDGREEEASCAGNARSSRKALQGTRGSIGRQTSHLIYPCSNHAGASPHQSRVGEGVCLVFTFSQ